MRGQVSLLTAIAIATVVSVAAAGVWAWMLIDQQNEQLATMSERVDELGRQLDNTNVSLLTFAEHVGELQQTLAVMQSQPAGMDASDIAAALGLGTAVDARQLGIRIEELEQLETDIERLDRELEAALNVGLPSSLPRRIDTINSCIGAILNSTDFSPTLSSNSCRLIASGLN